MGVGLMRLVKNFLSLGLAALLVISPISVAAEGNVQEVSSKTKEITKSLQVESSKGKKKSLGKNKAWDNPMDYPLVSDGELVDTLFDSYGNYQELTFNSISDYNNDSMNFEVKIYSEEANNKDPYVFIEFYKENNNAFQYLGYIDFNTSGYNTYTMGNILPKSLYDGEEYVYALVGILGSMSDEYYSDYLYFKVENPYYTEEAEPEPEPDPTGVKNYVIINNESVDGNTKESTGSFKINNDEYTFNKKLGLSAYKLDVNRPFDVAKNKGKQIRKSSKSKVKAYQVGDSKNFWVYDFASGTDTSIGAKLLYSGTKANIWVNNNQISSADATKLGKEYDNKIYSAVTQNFANESDVDKDGKVNILCYDIQDGFSGSGGYIGGYFWAGDLFDITGSNKSEIFYIDTYPSMGMSSTKDVSQAYGTLAHEFQHMVNFNQNYFIEGDEMGMDVWLDEGLAMAAEQVYSGVGLQDRIDYYNYASSIANGHSLLYWDENGDVLSNYSLSYLFGQYVKAQTGKGNAIFKEILKDTNNDYKAVENVVQKYVNSSMTFGKIMTNFRGALLLKKDTGEYGFKGDPFFDSLSPRLYGGSSAQLRGGGAIIKANDANDIDIPVSKGADITYTYVSADDVDEKDTTPPVKPTVNEVDDNDTAVTGTTEANASVYVRIGSTVKSAVADSDGKFSVTIPKQKAGTVLKVYAEDQAKNKSEEVTVKVIDKTPPGAPVVNEVKDYDKKVTGKAEAGSKVTVKSGSKTLGESTAKTNGSYSVTMKSAQKAGTTLTVTATDKDKNVSKATKKTVADKTAPGVPKVNNIKSSSTTVTGTAEKNATVYVKVGSKVIGSNEAQSSGKFSVKISKQKAKTKVYVYAADKAGNVGKSTKKIVQK